MNLILDMQTVRRTMVATHINAVSNHPDVRSALGGDGVLDVTALVSAPGNLAFVSEHGAIVCVGLGSGHYDVHTMFLPDGRGREARAAVVEMLDYMFMKTDCVELRTSVPEDNVAAAAASKHHGFEMLYRGRLPWTGGTTVNADFFALSLTRWASRSVAASKYGAWFHQELASAKLDHGSDRHVHDDDPTHDSMVGAAAMMIMSDNVEKGVRFYNVWAGSAGYRSVELLRVRPAVLDIHDAIVEIQPAGMEILQCR